MDYKIWFACTDNPEYCSEIEFLDSSSDNVHWANYKNVVKPGDIYVIRHQKTNDASFKVMAYLLHDNPPEKQPAILKSWTPSIVGTHTGISEDWILTNQVVHGILAGMGTSECDELFMAMREGQLLHIRNDKLPQRGT